MPDHRTGLHVPQPDQRGRGDLRLGIVRAHPGPLRQSLRGDGDNPVPRVPLVCAQRRRGLGQLDEAAHRGAGQSQIVMSLEPGQQVLQLTGQDPLHLLDRRDPGFRQD